MLSTSQINGTAPNYLKPRVGQNNDAPVRLGFFTQDVLFVVLRNLVGALAEHVGQTP